jgi:hypothetical protein
MNAAQALANTSHQALIEAAYPDWETCTGDDATCPCLWHDEHRHRDPDDPYGVIAAAGRADAVFRQQTRLAILTLVARQTDPAVIEELQEVLAHVDR